MRSSSSSSDRCSYPSVRKLTSLGSGLIQHGITVFGPLFNVDYAALELRTFVMTAPSALELQILREIL